MWRTKRLNLFEGIDSSFDEHVSRALVTNSRSFVSENRNDLMELLGGGTLVEYSDQAQKAVMQFDARREFCHSDGKVVQGGFVTAWMDAAMAHALRHASHGEYSAVTLELKVTFVSPTGPGRVIAKGWVVSMGRTVAFLEGQLFDGSGKLLATSSSTAKLARVNP